MNTPDDFRSLLLYSDDLRGVFYDADPLLSAKRKDTLDDPDFVEVRGQDKDLSPEETFLGLVSEIGKAIRRAIACTDAEDDDTNSHIDVMSSILEKAQRATLGEALRKVTRGSQFFYASKDVFEKLADQDDLELEAPRISRYEGVEIAENEFLEEGTLLLLDLEDFTISESIQSFQKMTSNVRYVWRGKLECLAPENQVIVVDLTQY